MVCRKKYNMAWEVYVDNSACAMSFTIWLKMFYATQKISIMIYVYSA